MNIQLKNKVSRILVAIAAALAFCASIIASAPGDLDPTFGSGGIVVTPIAGSPYSELASSMQIQTDGKILVSGQIWTEDVFGDERIASFFIARYLRNGVLDSSFGTGGKIIGPFGFVGAYVGEEIVLQSDGKLLAVGRATDGSWNPVIAVHRYNFDGTPDTSFGSGGQVSTPVEGSFSIGEYVTVQPDGKIVVAGYSYLPDADNFAFAVVRYHPNGTLDTSFSTDGKVVTPVGSNFAFVGAVLVQPDGKIVIVGGAGVNNLFTLVRYDANGSLDLAFGVNGIVQQSIFGPAWFNDGLLQPDGKIVAVGTSNGRDAVIRYNSNGSMDTDFASSGIYLADIFDSYDKSIFLRHGKLLVFSGAANGVSVLQLNNDGMPDLTFGTDGRVITPISSGSISKAVDGALQSDGKVVALARTYEPSGSGFDIAIVRYLGARPEPFDFDGDRRADLSVFRPSDKVWYLNQSTEGFSAVQFGLSTDKITPGDYDGDGKADIAVYRDGTWYWLNSSTNSFSAFHFGIVSDIPQPADYTGDGRDELAVYRNGTWYMYDLANDQVSAVQFGGASDKPVPADYDGDGRVDQAVYRGSGEWYLNRSSQGFAAMFFGLATDKPVPNDYDGDGKTDIAVFRPSDGNWYIKRSSDDQISAINWGLGTDIPVPGDYDGDGRTDIAVYRDGIWYILQSSNGTIKTEHFGLSTDIPVASANVQ